MILLGEKTRRHLIKDSCEETIVWRQPGVVGAELLGHDDERDGTLRDHFNDRDRAMRDHLREYHSVPIDWSKNFFGS